MTAAPSPDRSSEFLPEAARQAIYPMRTQPRSIRVTYMVEPAAFACVVLPEAAAILAHSGAGLAVGGSTVLAGPAGDGAGHTAVAAASGHSHSLG